ncbi:hypothetical protein M8J77_006725 [Diaphorina citri]|nr:hypothetical protein M8J77_006725 [Diaphorina citri]
MGSNSDINGIVKTFNDLEEFRNQELNENENLVEIITRLENEIEELENIHAEKKTYIEHQNVIIQNLERDNKTLKSRNYCKDIEICDLRNVYQEVEDLNEENERNEKELSCYNNKIITLKETKVQLEETLIEKDNIILRNENQLNELEMKIIGCRKKVDKMSEENATTRTRQEDCERNLETSKLQNVQLTDKSRLIENAKQKSEEINKSNQYQIKQLRNDITKEATNNSKMQNRILNLETEQKNIKKENLQLKEKVMTLQHILEDGHEELERLDEELREKINEFNNYKATINKLKNKIMNNTTLLPPPQVCRPTRAFSTITSRYSMKATRHTSHPATYQFCSRNMLNAKSSLSSTCKKIIDYEENPRFSIEVPNSKIPENNNIKRTKRSKNVIPMKDVIIIPVT